VYGHGHGHAYDPERLRFLIRTGLAPALKGIDRGYPDVIWFLPPEEELMKRWDPSVPCSEREERLLKLAAKSRKLLVFLRERRHEIFDDGFQAELASMYRSSGQGEEPQPPALLCMAMLLQGYLQVSDAEAVRLSATDSCWRMVLGTLSEKGDKPAFSQGGLQQFRERVVHHDMDRRLLERTIEVAKRSRSFDWKKLPKSLRVALDSRPLAGAGRVEDTLNLLGHAGRKVAECVAMELETSFDDVCRKAGAPLLLASSIKAGLDIEWNDAEVKEDALNRLWAQLEKLRTWVQKSRSEELDVEHSPLNRYIEALEQVQQQDVEAAPGGRVRLHQGVAGDRRISIEDADMRHGRKSKSKRFDGYKQHVSTHVDAGLVLACEVTPANRPEEEAVPALAADMARMGLAPNELLVDRAYINSVLIDELVERGGTVVCRPWRGNNGKTGLFGKKDFKINVRDDTITCPAGQVEPFEPGQEVEFDPDVCGACELRAQCTKAASGRGRTVTMRQDEALQKKLRHLQQSRAGRIKLRERVGVEHTLAHLANRQGPRARYRGLRKNVFDLRRMAVIQNLETVVRREQLPRAA
jgi:hypothetical protein